MRDAGRALLLYQYYVPAANHLGKRTRPASISSPSLSHGISSHLVAHTHTMHTHIARDTENRNAQSHPHASASIHLKIKIIRSRDHDNETSERSFVHFGL